MSKTNPYEGFGDFLKGIPDEPIRTKTKVTDNSNNDPPKDDNNPDALPCGCIPHKTRPNDLWGGIYCDTEKQGYCNFECPHEES